MIFRSEMKCFLYKYLHIIRGMLSPDRLSGIVSIYIMGVDPI